MSRSARVPSCHTSSEICVKRPSLDLRDATLHELHRPRVIVSCWHSLLPQLTVLRWLTLSLQGGTVRLTQDRDRGLNGFVQGQLGENDGVASR